MDLALAEARVAEVLTARLCHELINPLGAVVNGIEILEDDPSFAADAAALIATSARQATSRLQFYRLAYGATVELAAGVVERAVTEFFAGSKITCHWPRPWPEVLPLLHWLKLAMNLLVLAADCLPRGGEIAVTMSQPDDAMPQLDVRAKGPTARVPDHVAEGLLDNRLGRFSTDGLTPRTAHAAFTILLAKRLGGTIAMDTVAPDLVTLRITFS